MRKQGARPMWERAMATMVDVAREAEVSISTVS
ncbi:MAG TPA: LacI family DNA-binding transcriptional regulator, partial [Acidobacteria bacterium]|nr:LacI family DNA-binding transcriptional regulator [Acidobacteriota bacterium]